jgi:molecular chaperone DnaJ
VRDPYEVLGIGRGAGDAEIRAAFRRLAAQHHPDRNPDDPGSQSRFREINAAHQILSDPKKRSLYDHLGPRAFAGAGGPGFVDVGESLLQDLLGAIGIKSNERGHVRARIELSFEEAALGCERSVSFERRELCERCGGCAAEPRTAIEACGACDGRGKVRYQQGILPLSIERSCSRCRGRGRIPAQPCSGCRGEGVVSASRAQTIRFPAGIEDGASHVVERAGSRTTPERPAGDLEVVVSVRPHPLFRRKGDDVVCTVPISFVHATLGGEVVVPTLEGKVRLRVPPATQPGAMLRIRGKGMPHRVRGGHGDQIVEVSVEIPSRLSERARELIAELGHELGEEVQPQQRTFVEKLRDLFG